MSDAVMLGASTSFTVTVKLMDAVFPDGSVAVQLTMVTPMENVEPEPGVQLTVT